MMLTAKRSYALLALCATFLLSACSSVQLNDSDSTQGDRTHKPGQAKHYTKRFSEEPLDPIVKSKPKKAPKDNPVYLERIGKVNQTLRKICANPAYRAYFSQTPCLPAGMKPSYLSNDAIPTPEERRVAQNLFQALDELNDTTREIMLKSGNPRHVESAKRSALTVQPRIHRLQEKFLKGQVTWEDYNKQRLDIFNETAGNESEE